MAEWLLSRVWEEVGVGKGLARTRVGVRGRDVKLSNDEAKVIPSGAAKAGGEYIRIKRVNVATISECMVGRKEMNVGRWQKRGGGGRERRVLCNRIARFTFARVALPKHLSVRTQTPSYHDTLGQVASTKTNAHIYAKPSSHRDSSRYNPSIHWGVGVSHSLIPILNLLPYLKSRRPTPRLVSCLA